MEILMKTPYPHNWWQTEGWNTWDFTAQTGCHEGLHTFMESGVPSSSISERRPSLPVRLQSGTVHDSYPKENIVSTFHRQTGRPCFWEKEDGREPGICTEARRQGLGLGSRNGKSRDNWGAITFCWGSQEVHHHVIAWVSLPWKWKLIRWGYLHSGKISQATWAHPPYSKVPLQCLFYIKHRARNFTDYISHTHPPQHGKVNMTSLILISQGEEGSEKWSDLLKVTQQSQWIDIKAGRYLGSQQKKKKITRLSSKASNGPPASIQGPPVQQPPPTACMVFVRCKYDHSHLNPSQAPLLLQGKHHASLQFPLPQPLHLMFQPHQASCIYSPHSLPG